MIAGVLCQKKAAANSAITQILMPLTTADGFVDIKNNHAITVVGSPTISTVQSKFGAGALLVSNGNYLRIASTPTLDLSGKVPFTFECWVFIDSGAGGGGILSMRTSAIHCPVAGQVQYTLIAFATLNNWHSVGTNIPFGNWVHYAVVGDGTNIQSYINGVSPYIIPQPSWPVGDRFLNIGFDPDGGITAYFNDVRVSSGVAYSGNFTPPSSPFTV